MLVGDALVVVQCCQVRDIAVNGSRILGSERSFFDGRIRLAVDNLADHDHFNRVPGLDSLPGTAEVEPHSPGRVKRVDSFSLELGNLVVEGLLQLVRKVENAPFVLLVFGDDMPLAVVVVLLNPGKKRTQAGVSCFF